VEMMAAAGQQGSAPRAWMNDVDLIGSSLP
jgi:hypothetical protein